MEKLHKFLKVFIFVQLGAWAGRALVRWLDYAAHPERYMIQSAPWYTEIILTAVLTLITVAITAAAYWLVGYRMKKRKQAESK